MRIVISQPMYFPWVGLLEQIRLADLFIHYDDVQYARGFFNRVQIKRENGVSWLTVPLRDLHQGQLINEVSIDERVDWRTRHRELLKHAYSATPYIDEMLNIVDKVFSEKVNSLGDLSRASVSCLSDYFGLMNGRRFICSSDLEIGGKGSERLRDICVRFHATTYITGHGALNYLNHEIFERCNIRVEYMNYKKMEYPQMHGAFTPFLTGLDLVANCGKEGVKFICSDAKYWKEFP